MKIRISIDRQSGPIIGSRLDFDYTIPEPAVDELRLPVVEPPQDYETTALYAVDAYARERAERRRELFVQEITAQLVRSITKGLATALDGEPSPS